MLEDFVKKYRYFLPENLIRKVPLEKRDNSKLLIYDTKTDSIMHEYFYNLDKYLPENSKLILNQTKVVPAKLPCVGKMGGKYDLFLVLNEWDEEGDISVFTDRPISKVKSKKLFLKANKNIEVELYKGVDGITYLKNTFPDFLEMLDKYGVTPIPHYLQSSKEKLQEEYIRKRYQTIFAKSGKSVAAPTASLHFTDEVFKNLEHKNIAPAYINLEIGRGTFSNLKEENILENRLHKEVYEILLETVEILENKEITKVVVGTTACRAIESFGKFGETAGETDIFIKDHFDFKYTDILITNFHLPETSLMALVDSFLKHRGAKKNILDLYKMAIENQYTFYSFGDAMLIL